MAKKGDRYPNSKSRYPPPQGPPHWSILKKEVPMMELTWNIGTSFWGPRLGQDGVQGVQVDTSGWVRETTCLSFLAKAI